MSTSTETHLQHNLWLVQSGRRTRAPGIRRCPDCDIPFIDDRRGVPHCPDCRINHTRHCQSCRTPFTNTRGGDNRCPSCRHQYSLFDAIPTQHG